MLLGQTLMDRFHPLFYYSILDDLQNAGFFSRIILLIKTKSFGVLDLINSLTQLLISSSFFSTVIFANVSASTHKKFKMILSRGAGINIIG